MGTVNSLMDLARQTLMADQAALGVISNNVANQNTPGYTRQVVTWQTRDSVTIGSYTVGQGVAVGSQGASQRDRILEQRVQQQTQIQAQSEALAFSSQPDSKRLQSQFDFKLGQHDRAWLCNGFVLQHTVHSDDKPVRRDIRQAVLTAAKNLSDAFNSASNQISQISARSR